MHLALLLLLLLLPLALPLAAAQSPSPSSSPQYTDPTLFQTTTLETTNRYRREHAAAPLAWNASLALAAQAWSDGCKFTHSGSPSGENLAAGYGNVTAAVEAWGEEREKYDFAKGGFSDETGHFSQLVWRATASVGCARTECNGGQGGAPGWYIVCEYFPAGNVLGLFQENVLPQLPEGEVPAASEPPSTTTGQVGGTAAATAAAGGAVRRFQGGVGLLWAAPGLAVAAGV
ncbi:hypothetical protein B5807_01370 [Epicoccum nigrum]|uniref:SCP domain-containing protein n=1 Tax=Epicoccum nigrum TaxID=105696 RepID=A0A1Y2MCK1_EPING|nr:hypothetical protein B5807_01370 [Epicoccum nigrum]